MLEFGQAWVVVSVLVVVGFGVWWLFVRKKDTGTGTGTGDGTGTGTGGVDR